MDEGIPDDKYERLEKLVQFVITGATNEHK